MKKVDDSSVALLLVGYKRIDFLIERLEEIKANTRIPVFISIDGSDKCTEDEITRVINAFILRNQDMEVSFKIQQENLGLANHITSAISGLLEFFGSVIVVEDDVVLSKCFVEIMIAGLETSLKDKSIGVVSGFSSLTGKNWLSHKNIFRKSDYFPCWGWAINKQNWEKYELSLPMDFESELNNSHIWASLGSFRTSLWRSRFTKVVGPNPPTWDYQMQYMLFKHDLQVLNTTQRITDNVGFNSYQSTNTIGDRPKWMGDLEVSRKEFRNSISKASPIYNLLDAYTIGGDVRPFRIALRLSKKCKSLKLKFRINS
jgi:hypothetical protein